MARVIWCPKDQKTVIASEELFWRTEGNMRIADRQYVCYLCRSILLTEPGAIRQPTWDKDAATAI